jgi:hypothetical protein
MIKYEYREEVAMQKHFRRFFVFLVIFLPFFPGILFGVDQRTVPVDMYLIFDGSLAIKNGKDGAVQWVCETIVDGLLQNGDTLTLWIASETAEQAFSGVIDGPEQKETIKNLIRSVTADGSSADYAGALRKALSLQNAQGGAAIPYTLLITGAGQVGSPGSANGIRGSETLGYLRYSRVEEFSGWRAMVTRLGMDRQIQQAAAAYMSTR